MCNLPLHQPDSLAAHTDLVTCEVLAKIEPEWEEYLAELQEKGQEWADHKLSPLVFYNGCRFIGGVSKFQDFAASAYEFKAGLNSVVYTGIAKQRFSQYVNRPIDIEGNKRQHAFLEFSITREDGGCFVFTLRSPS